MSTRVGTVRRAAGPEPAPAPNFRRPGFPSSPPKHARDRADVVAAVEIEHGVADRHRPRPVHREAGVLHELLRDLAVGEGPLVRPPVDRLAVAKLAPVPGADHHLPGEGTGEGGGRIRPVPDPFREVQDAGIRARVLLELGEAEGTSREARGHRVLDAELRVVVAGGRTLFAAGSQMVAMVSSGTRAVASSTSPG